MNKRYDVFVWLALMVLVLTACTANGTANETAIEASGTISSVEIAIASELSGKVFEVAVQEGDSVQRGDVLFRLGDELVQAQYKQAETAAAYASASLDAARLQLQAAQTQYDLVLQSARLQSRQIRQADWQAVQPDIFELPNWYFDQDEKIMAAQQVVDAAEAKRNTEKMDLDEVLAQASNQDFLAVESRLAVAQGDYLAAQLTLDKAESAAGEKVDLVNAAQKNLDSAEAELEASQLEYDRILTTAAAENVLEARARAAVAQIMLENAQDQYDNLQTGEQSLPVQAADLAVRQAEALVAQAEAGLAQAEAALELLDLQLEKSVVKAPEAATVLSVNLDAGEVLGAGSLVMTLGILDEMSLTVYVPEDQYGQVQVGQSVSVTVDSFPNRVFEGVVRYIADEAEFTPRNVQTAEGRKTTVYAVKISLKNPDLVLKPGMSADAKINE